MATSLQSLTNFSAVHSQATSTAAHGIVINEVYARPAAHEAEWVELYNTTDHEINITGWQLSRGADHALVGSVSEKKIAARGFGLIVLPTGSDSLPDQGATLALHSKAPTQENNFIVHQFIYNAVTVGRSFGLNKDGSLSEAKPLEVVTQRATNNERCLTSTLPECTLAKPTLTSPHDKSVRRDPIIRYEWQPVEQATSYVFESYHDEGLTIAHKRISLINNFTEIEESDEDVIWWRVRAVSAEGKAAPWSDTRKLTIDRQVPNIKNITQANNTIVRGDAVFRFATEDEHPASVVVSLDGDLQSLNNMPTHTRAIEGIGTITVTVNLDSTSVPDGPHQLVVFANDQAGNQSEKITVDFLVDNIADSTPSASPSVEPLQPLPLPKSRPIETLLGGDIVLLDETNIGDKPTVLSSQDTKSKKTPSFNTPKTLDTQKQTLRTDSTWPAWVGVGAAASGVGWLLWSFRRRSI